MQINKLILLFLIFLLVGCHQEFSHEYLLQHVDVLHQEYERCRQVFSEHEAYCRMVRRTMDDFDSIAKVQQMDPDEFGLQIMDAERRLVELREKLRELSPSDGKKFQEVSRQCEEQALKVKMLLGVILMRGR